MLGRVAELAPAIALPPLRTTLMQLITEVAYSASPQQRENAAVGKLAKAQASRGSLRLRLRMKVKVKVRFRPEGTA